MTITEFLITALPFIAGGWAAWALPRWAGEGTRPSTSSRSDDWSYDGLPSRPYRDLDRVS